LFPFFSGDSEVARIVIDESNAEGEEAKKFLEDVRVTFPQVCGYMLRSFDSNGLKFSLQTENHFLFP
jgi:predicted nucleotidyltransferase